MNFKIHPASQRKFDAIVDKLSKEVGLKSEEILKFVTQHVMDSARANTPQAKKKKRKVHELSGGRYKIWKRKQGKSIPVYSTKKNAADLPKHVKYKLYQGMARENWNQLLRILDLKPASSKNEDVRRAAPSQVHASFKKFPTLKVVFESENERVAGMERFIMSKAFAKGVRKMTYLLNKLGDNMESLFN